MKYTNRMCHLLNNGLHIAPVALLYHAEAEWSGDYMFFQKPAHWLTRSQIDFDVLPSDVFADMGHFKASFDGINCRSTVKRSNVWSSLTASI